MIDTILNLSGKELKEKILSSSNKKELLRNEKVRKNLFQRENHYAFIWIIQALKKEEILYLCDKDLLPYLEQDFQKRGKINAIIAECNHYAIPFLTQPTILSYMNDFFTDFDCYLKCYDESFALPFSKYLVQHYPTKLYRINYLNPNCFNKIISDEIVKEHLLNMEDIESFIRDSSVFLLNNLIKYPKYKNTLLNCSLNIINSKVKNGFILPLEFLENKEFLSRYIEIEDVTLYRDYIENLNINNPYFAEKIEKERKKLYEKTFLTVDKETGVLPIFLNQLNDLKSNKIMEDNYYPINYYFLKNLLSLNDEEVIKQLRLLSEKQLFEITIDYAFKDIPYNFYQNLKVLLEYYEKIQQKFIPEDRLSIYQKLYNYDKLTILEKINLFEEIKERNSLIEEFYDDFRMSKDICYKDLKKSLIKKEDLEKLKSEELSKKCDIPVYELKGEKFNLLVTCTKNPREYPYHSMDKVYVSTSSTSFISDKNIRTFSPNNITVSFIDFDESRIMHLYPSDSYTNREEGSRRISKLYTPEDFVENTVAYNEILYDNRVYVGEMATEPLKADYVVCYDTIEKGDLSYAKANGNIPIILLHTSYYKMNNEFVMDSIDDVYYPDVDYIKGDYYRRK